MRSRVVNDTGFTLVELLVVMAIISLLTGILASVLGRARQQANQTRCAAQLHQLGAAFAIYSNDQKGWLPAWGGWHVFPPGSSPDDEPGDAWTEQLARNYVSPDSPTYHCPEAAAPGVSYFLSGRWAASQGRHATRLSELRTATQFVLAGESTNRHLYAPPYGDAIGRASDDCDKDDAAAPCACFPEDGGYLNHRGGNQILFGDLHVAGFDRFDPAAMTFDAVAMRRWEDVLPRPGRR